MEGLRRVLQIPSSVWKNLIAIISFGVFVVERVLSDQYSCKDVMAMWLYVGAVAAAVDAAIVVMIIDVWVSLPWNQ